MHRKIIHLSPILTWVIIIVVPMLSGITISQITSRLFGIILGTVVFILLIISGEWILRITIYLLSEDWYNKQKKVSRYDIGNIVSQILTDSSIRYSTVISLCSHFSTDPVIGELVCILNQCVDNNTDKFDHVKIRNNRARLNYIMNILRT